MKDKLTFFKKLNKIDTFSPYFFFPFIYVLYFFVSLFDFSRFAYFDVNRNVFFPLFIGLVVYLGAVYIADKKDWVFPSFGLSRFLKGKTIYFLWALGLIGLICYLIMLFTGQVGISDESIRRNLDPKLNFMSALLWFAVIFLLCDKILKEQDLTRRKQFSYGIILLVVFILFVLMGYRTPIAVMFLTSFIVFHYIIKKIKLSWFLTVLVVLGLLFSLFGFFRVVTEDTTKKFNDRTGPKVEITQESENQNLALIREINKTPKWVRALNGEMVTGHIVLSKIMEYTDIHGYTKGSLHAGIFSTILPGEQKSPRTVVTDMVNSLTVDEGKYITRPGRTTTPTFPGQLYAEAGYIGIIIGFAIYGLVLSMLYNQVRRSGIKSYQTAAYGFVTAIFTLSIHTGLLDLIFILMIGYAILSTSIEKTARKI